MISCTCNRQNSEQNFQFQTGGGGDLVVSRPHPLRDSFKSECDTCQLAIICQVDHSKVPLMWYRDYVCRWKSVSIVRILSEIFGEQS